MNMATKEYNGKNESEAQGNNGKNNIFYFGDFSYLDLIEEDDGNDDYFKNFGNEIFCSDNRNNIVSFPVPTTQKECSSNNKNNEYQQSENQKESHLLTEQKTNSVKNEIPNMSFREFKEYLNLKINGDKNQKVMKESLMIVHQQLQFYLHISPLSRSEKRDKNKILRNLYNYSTELLNCIETIPNILRPVWLHFRNKRIIKKVKLYRKRAFKNNK